MRGAHNPRMASKPPAALTDADRDRLEALLDALPGAPDLCALDGFLVGVGGATFVIPLEGVIDIAAERGRLAKALAAAEKERDALARRLASPGFAEKAKPEAVEKARADHAERSAEAERIGAALGRLT